MSKTVYVPEREAFQQHLRQSRYQMRALWSGGLGILAFSFTFPAIHFAEPAFGSIIAGPGRVLLATPLAILILWLRHERIPPRHTWAGLCCVAFGAIIGYTLFSTLALERTSVAHSAILTGLLPAATASYSMVRARKRPSLLFRLSSVAGMFTVLFFALMQGGGQLQSGDGWMILAIISGTVGYAEGGNLARELGGVRMICWAFVIATPFLILPVGWSVIQHQVHWNNPWAWLGLMYIAIGSLFFGLLAWYYGLARGGIARVSQLQLLQPLLTIGWAALLLHEQLTWLTGLAALLVVCCVTIAISQQSRPPPAVRPQEEKILVSSSRTVGED